METAFPVLNHKIKYIFRVRLSLRTLNMISMYKTPLTVRTIAYNILFDKKILNCEFNGNNFDTTQAHF